MRYLTRTKKYLWYILIILLSLCMVPVEGTDRIQAERADQLEGTENRIAVERGRYNDLVKDYNTRVTQLPGKFIAPMFGFSTKAYFEAAAGAETTPQVKLNQ